MTLQWATRMGGVNHAAPTITHSVNNDGQPTSTVSRTSMEQAADAQEPIQSDREQFDTDEVTRIVNENFTEDEIWPDESPQGDEM